MRANLKLIEGTPNTVNRKVVRSGARTSPQTPSRPTNASLRPREYLTADEVEKLVKAAKAGRWSDRDAATILIAYRHGLRAQEIADLEWSQVEEGRTPTLHVRRVKNGKPSAHPIRGDEMRALRKLPRETPYVFTTERGGQFTADAINRQVKSIGARAELPFPVHAHMLRHGCGYALANAGHDTRAIQAWLGHANIQHTVRYTELAANRFASFWR
jgi:integrase